jgi:hypothetical protein
MGRNPGEEPRQYQIQQLWECHHEILRRLVIGQKSVDIARDLNVTTAVVSYVKNSEIGKRQLSLMRSSADMVAVNVAGKIKELAAKAIAVMEASLDDDQPLTIRMKGAVDILDRAGHAAPRLIQTANLHTHLTREDIEELKQRARSEGVITDAVFSEVME